MFPLLSLDACRYSGFFSEGATSSSRPWFLSFTFAVACCVIVSGCLAERTRLLVYPAYTVVLASVVHPLIVHWVWMPHSWLNRVSSCPVLDYAGGLPVHALGERGACTMCACAAAVACMHVLQTAYQLLPMPYPAPTN